MADNTKNKIIVLEPSTKATKDLLALISEKGLAEIVMTTTPDEALQQVASSLPCMMIVGIQNNAEVPTRIQLFKRVETAIKLHGLKIYVVSTLKNRQLADLVTQKMGVADYIVEPVPVRTMMFKANLQLKAVDNFRRQQEMKKLADEKIVIKKLDGGKKAEAGGTSELKTSQKPALEADQDTFLFKNSGVKKTGKKFTVELEGPDPSTGEWVPHEDKGDAQSSWRWVPNEEKENQSQGAAPKDGWVHDGDKPLFNENSQKWAMTSEKPSLALVAQGKTVAKKIGTDEKGDVFVADDSPKAEENIRKNRLKVAKVKAKSRLPLAELNQEEEAAQKPAHGEPNQGEPSDESVAKEISPGGLVMASPAKTLGLKGAAASGGASAGELHDRRTAEGKATSSVAQEATPEAANEGKAALTLKVPSKEATKPQSPLDFLKKKKEEQKTAEVTTLGADPLLKGANPLQEGSAEVGTDLSRGEKRKRKRATNDPLARLNASLEEELPETEDEKASLDSSFFEEEDDNQGAGPVLGIKGRAKEELDERGQLRDDPASKRAQVNDKQALGSAKRIGGLRGEKKKALEEIQALLGQELTDELAPEEEEKLRTELGLKGRPGISAKDLQKKKRLKDIKKLKDKLSDFDLAIAEEEKGEIVSGSPTSADEESAETTQGDLRADKLRGIRRAIDGAETPASEESEAERQKMRANEKAEKKPVRDDYLYLPQADLQPLENAWDKAGDHYVYLSATVRFQGFGKLDELMPLWFFSGEKNPELLDKTKQWRFQGRLPVLAKTPAELPSEVRDFLLGIRDQIALNREKGREEEEEGEEEEKGSGSVPDGGIAEIPETEMAADETVPEEKRKKGKSKAARDLGKSVDEMLAERVDAGSATEEADGSPDGAREEEVSAEESGGREKKERREEKAEDPLAHLRAKLATDEGTTEENEEPRDERDEAKADAGAAYADKLGERAEFKGEGVQKFLARRKKKKQDEVLAEEPVSASESNEHVSDFDRLKNKLAQAEADSAKAENRGVDATRGPSAIAKTVYLGVLIALADASDAHSDPGKTIEKVLNAVESAFGGCYVACTALPDSEGKARIRHRSASAPVSDDPVSLKEALSLPIVRTNGASEEILGYLMVQTLHGRVALGPGEEKTTKQVAERLWPMISSVQKENRAA